MQLCTPSKSATGIAWQFRYLMYTYYKSSVPANLPNINSSMVPDIYWYVVADILW